MYSLDGDRYENNCTALLRVFDIARTASVFASYFLLETLDSDTVALSQVSFNVSRCDRGYAYDNATVLLLFFSPLCWPFERSPMVVGRLSIVLSQVFQSSFWRRLCVVPSRRSLRGRQQCDGRRATLCCVESRLNQNW